MSNQFHPALGYVTRVFVASTAAAAEAAQAICAQHGAACELAKLPNVPDMTAYRTVLRVGSFAENARAFNAVFRKCAAISGIQWVLP